MTDALIPVQNPAVTDTNLDAEGLTVSGQAVKRERMQLAGALDVEIARVENVPPASTDYGVVTRPLPILQEVSYLTSGARSATQTQGDQTNPGAKGIAVTIDVTVWASGSITPEIDVKDPVSGKYIPLLTGAAIVAVSTVVLRVYPGLTAAANLVANDVLWRTFRVKVTASGSSITYSVGYVLLP